MTLIRAGWAATGVLMLVALLVIRTTPSRNGTSDLPPLFDMSALAAPLPACPPPPTGEGTRPKR